MSVDETQVINLRPIINQIRERLHSNQAAAMVGAGFSLNAIKKSADAPKFPLWGNLTNQIFHRVYPGYPYDDDKLNPEQLKFKTQKTADSLRLAQDFEESDRNKLDEFLERAIPDSSYDPGNLHKQLLSLPWADVFTTNIDTLLERTTDYIDRPYSKVLAERALSSASPPCIVKLHGTLGHHNYVFTERDFSNYPVRYPAFVNYVQTSQMINTFCLFGFSGDDPNFKRWNDWVLNVLENHAPQIYLIGILNLSEVDKNYWRGRKVIPVDLSVLFSADQEKDHAFALEWLLNELSSDKRSPVKDESDKQDEEVKELLLSWPSTPGADNNEFYWPDGLEGGLEGNLRKVVAHWREQRLAYPGWLVTPRENRETLWLWTERWIDPIFQVMRSMDESEAVVALYELCWRIHRCLFPLLVGQAKVIAALLEAVNPFPDKLELDNAKIARGDEESAALAWEILEEAWFELAFTVAQEAREDLDEERFALWMSRLEKVVPEGGRWWHRWYHEQCLMALYQLDQDELEQRLNRWVISRTELVWLLKKSAFLAELGRFEAAEELLEEILKDTAEAGEGTKSPDLGCVDISPQPDESGSEVQEAEVVTG